MRSFFLDVAGPAFLLLVFGSFDLATYVKAKRVKR